MILTDVNVLVYAHRADAPEHAHYREWLERMVNRPAPFGVPSLVCSGFLRIMTHPRVFDPPTTLPMALSQIENLRSRPNHVVIEPGPRHWRIFADLCSTGNAKGNLIADAYLAAIAVETGCRWATTDRDFARFPGLDWFHPLES